MQVLMNETNEVKRLMLLGPLRPLEGNDATSKTYEPAFPGPTPVTIEDEIYAEIVTEKGHYVIVETEDASKYCLYLSKDTLNHVLSMALNTDAEDYFKARELLMTGHPIYNKRIDAESLLKNITIWERLTPIDNKDMEKYVYRAKIDEWTTKVYDYEIKIEEYYASKDSFNYENAEKIVITRPAGYEDVEAYFTRGNISLSEFIAYYGRLKEMGIKPELSQRDKCLLSRIYASIGPVDIRLKGDAITVIPKEDALKWLSLDINVNRIIAIYYNSDGYYLVISLRNFLEAELMKMLGSKIPKDAKVVSNICYISEEGKEISVKSLSLENLLLISHRLSKEIVEHRLGGKIQCEDLENVFFEISRKNGVVYVLIVDAKEGKVKGIKKAKKLWERPKIYGILGDTSIDEILNLKDYDQKAIAAAYNLLGKRIDSKTTRQCVRELVAEVITRTYGV